MTRQGGGAGGSQNVRRRQGGRPPLPPLKYENLIDEEVKGVDADMAEEEGQGMVGRFFGGIRAAFDAAFGWCNDRDEEEVMDIERASAESLTRFKIRFMEMHRSLAPNG